VNYKKIGVVGSGFVGTALTEGMSACYDVHTYDKFRDSTCDSIEALCTNTKIIFVCVPTPMNPDGSCSLDIVESVISEIDSYSKNHIAVIKSTVPPGTTTRLNKACKNLQVVFSPEFLTEANFVEDFRNPTRIIVGGPRPASTIIKNIFRKVFPEVPIIKTGSNTAEMVKYFLNTFLATKVTFSNEIKEICEEIDIDYDKVVEYSLYDKRIGSTHLSAPGPDGLHGFGGSCFPKDLNALIFLAKQLGLNPNLLSAVWEKNLQVREDRDWEKLKGRAITHKKEN
tara:strand:- start:2909 stop:3757 length:849 start_codon:yes stop_codon:yes gene_type:complete